VSAAGPLRGPQGMKEAASPPLLSLSRRAGYGAAPPASRVLRIALRATALRAALDPGDLGGPWRPEERAGQGLPRPCARRKPPAVAGAGEHPDARGTE
jgi:hypothetical protein